MKRQDETLSGDSVKEQGGKLRHYRVVKGFQDVGTGSVAISPLSSIRLGLSDTEVKQINISGRMLKAVVRSGLEDDVVAMMEADRDKLSIALGDRVVVLKTEEDESSPEITEGTMQMVGEMVVVKGDLDDPDSPPTVRVSGKLFRRFGVQDGAAGRIASEIDGVRHEVVLRQSDRSVQEDQIALRKRLRDNLKVDIGETVTLWVETGESRPRRRDTQTDTNGRLLITDTPIVDLDVDAIVNAANAQLRGGGGVDGAIHEAAGPELRRTCRALKGCKVGRVKVTEGYDLPAKYVFHAVGPQWENGTRREHELLASCYRQALAIAKKQGIKTIAFPCISTGVYGFPLEDATIIAFREILSFIESNETPQTVYLCPFTDEEAQVYWGVYKLWQAGITVDQILLVALARSGSDDESVELSAKGAKSLSVKEGAEIRLASGDKAGTFHVSVGESAYPERRCRLNAKARKKLGIEKGDAIHVVL